MIKPHGSDILTPLFVADDQKREELLREAASLPSLQLNSAAASNAVMLGAGYFNPLLGYMDLADSLAVAEKMTTTSGLFWPVPCLNLGHDPAGFGAGSRIVLRDPNVAGSPALAIQNVASVEEASEEQLKFLCSSIFGTLDVEHPGVSTFLSQGRFVLSGPIEVLNYSYFPTDFPETFQSAYEIRAEIERRGWQRVVGFQTRNPMHRAHEELCKIAKEAAAADGVLIHMLLGKLKSGDIPGSVRDKAIRTMVEFYFPENTVMVSGYGFDMLYAGPREAVLHALFRQNAGCTHLIVGRDHAGVGDYYGPFEAQDIFDNGVPPEALNIKIFKADHTAYSKKLNKVVMMRDAPDHQPQDFVLLSGTKVREMLAAGEALPPEFARPEVANILMEYYQKASNT